MPKSIKRCADDLAGLLSRKPRVTLSAGFFRETVDRTRIEGTFLDQLYDYCLDNKSLVVIKITDEKYLLVKTTDRYLPQDPYKPPTDEDEE